MDLDHEHSFFDADDKTALVCVDHQHYQRLIVSPLVELGYKLHLGLFAEDVLLKLATYSYDVVVVYENFKGASLADNPILHELVQRPAWQRRAHFVVLLSPHFPTNDAMSAFVQSVDLIINIADMANFKPIVRRGVAQHEQLYDPFRQTIKAVEMAGS